MSVAGISSSIHSNYTSQNNQGPFQNYWPEFRQLDMDLKAGNLDAAQTNLTSLLKNAPQLTSNASTQDSSTLASTFKQLEQDLQAGNLSAAQQDFATVKQYFASLSPQPNNSPLAQDFSSYSQQSGQNASDEASASSVSINA